MTDITYRDKTYKAKDIHDLSRMLEADGYKHSYKIAERFMREFNPKPKPKSQLKMAEVVNGAKAILNVAKGEVASQEEITRRASICTSCPMTSETSDCIGCGFGERLVAFTKKLRTDLFGASYKIPNGMERLYCKVCSCSLAIMIPSKMSAFNEKDGKQAERPNHCWVKKESPNYKP
jgi:hypothetical protein